MATISFNEASSKDLFKTDQYLIKNTLCSDFLIQRMKIVFSSNIRVSDNISDYITGNS